MRKRMVVCIFVLMSIIVTCGIIYLRVTVGSNRARQHNEIISQNTMHIVSSELKNNERIPVKYTCDGADGSPDITITDLPEKTASIALIMDDPDAPGGVWDHWVVFNIPATSDRIGVDERSGVSGNNSWGRLGYGGPCPPDGEHRYFFHAYALDVMLPLSEGASKQAVLSALDGHVLAEAILMGRYERISH